MSIEQAAAVGGVILLLLVELVLALAGLGLVVFGLKVLWGLL